MAQLLKGRRRRGTSALKLHGGHSKHMSFRVICSDYICIDPNYTVSIWRMKISRTRHGHISYVKNYNILMKPMFRRWWYWCIHSGLSSSKFVDFFCNRGEKNTSKPLIFLKKGLKLGKHGSFLKDVKQIFMIWAEAGKKKKANFHACKRKLLE